MRAREKLVGFAMKGIRTTREALAGGAPQGAAGRGHSGRRPNMLQMLVTEVRISHDDSPCDSTLDAAAGTAAHAAALQGREADAT